MDVKIIKNARGTKLGLRNSITEWRQTYTARENHLLVRLVTRVF